MSERMYAAEVGGGNIKSVMAHRRSIEPPAPDFEWMMAEAGTSRPLVDLAFDLGIEEWALALLGVVWFNQYKAWAFPMRNASAKVVGIRLRSDRGEKFAVRGSHDGIFVPFDLEKDGLRRLYIAEGPSDVAAGLSLKLPIIGRASAHGSVLTVVDYVRKKGIREVVIISDADNPGISGAKYLLDLLDCRACIILLPCKDLRQFYGLGGTRGTIDVLEKSVIWKPCGSAVKPSERLECGYLNERIADPL
jgi:hypothetical protein